MDKLASGPAFFAHRCTCVGKTTDKLNQLQTSVEAAKTKLIEVSNRLPRDGEPSDEVMASYKDAVQHALRICDSWALSHGLPEDGPVDLPLFQKTYDAKDDFLHRDLAASNMAMAKDKENIHGLAYFQLALKTMKAGEDIYNLEELMQILKEDYVHVEKLVKGLYKIAADVKSYEAQKRKKAERAESAKKAKQEKQLQDERVALAKKNAQDIKNGQKASHSIFAVAADKWQQVAIRDPSAALEEKDFQQPWVIRGQASVATWRNTAKLSIKLSEFAGSYKRSPTYKSDKRSQAVMEAGGGKEETDALFQSMFAPPATLDVSKVQGASAAMQSIWFWGYDPKISGATLAPNAVARLQILLMGELTVIAFPLRNVIEVMKETQALEDIVLDSVMAFVLAVSDSEACCYWSKLKGSFVVLKPDDVLFMPAGWVVCERSSASVLVYGVRKSYLLPGEDSKNNFSEACELLKRSGRDPTKMFEVLACWP